MFRFFSSFWQHLKLIKTDGDICKGLNLPPIGNPQVRLTIAYNRNKLLRYLA